MQAQFPRTGLPPATAGRSARWTLYRQVDLHPTLQGDLARLPRTPVAAAGTNPRCRQSQVEAPQAVTSALDPRALRLQIGTAALILAQKLFLGSAASPAFPTTETAWSVLPRVGSPACGRIARRSGGTSSASYPEPRARKEPAGVTTPGIAVVVARKKSGFGLQRQRSPWHRE